MPQEPSPPPEPTDASDSLEGPSTVVEANTTGSSDTEPTTTLPSSPEKPQPAVPKPPTRRFSQPIKQLRSHFNIYLIAFIVLALLMAGGIIFAVLHNSHANTKGTASSQNLTTAELNQLQGSNAVIGSSNQTLTIQSDATFSGAVLMKNSLSIAGTLQIGGSLNLPGISVSGSSNFGTVQATSLTVTGDVVTQGSFAIQKSLSVASGGNFGGTVSAAQVVTQNLQLTGDIQIDHHIVTGGSVPSKTSGNALGNGGTAAVSGSDTAGTLTINTGSTTAAGCFVTVTFAQKFATTPHVVVTPIGASGAGLEYYVTRTNTDFSLCTATAAPAGVSFNFDYIVVD